MKRSAAIAFVLIAVSSSIANTAHADTKNNSTFHFPGTTITISVDPKEQARVAKIGTDLGQAVINEMNRLGRSGNQPPPPPPQPPPQPPPPPNGGDFTVLPVPGFGDAIVSVPMGARAPKSVMVATHGNNGSPENTCEYWKPLVGNRGFVLCIRGPNRPGTKPEEHRYTHGKEMPAEINAAVTALRARYGSLVDPGPMMYSGYSQGAGMGPSFVMKNASRFTRALMIEGGTGGWNEAAYAKAGGQRVLFACGQVGCKNSGQATVGRFERARVAAKVAYAPGAGHTPDGQVKEQLRAEWEWFLEGDPRWAL